MHVQSRLLRSAAFVMVATVSGCVTVRPPDFLEEPEVRDWGQTLSQARSLATAGETARADSVLARYAAHYPTTPQAMEANYWRALLNLRSPGSQNLSFAVPLLQTYTNAGPTTEHWMEADALLRAAARLDTVSRAAASYVSRGEVSIDSTSTKTEPKAIAGDAKPSTAEAKAQDEEIRRLRDELAKSKDELDRIKKRLAEPPKKPPR